MTFLRLLLSIVVLLASAWILGFAVFYGAVLIMSPLKMDQKTDAIVVLTGGKNRVEAGLDLLAQDMAPHLFITGVNEHVTKEEILARHNGPLSDNALTLGYMARTTTQNATETQQWVNANHIKSIRLVTSNYHMPRVLLEFHHALPDVKIIPYPVTKTEMTPNEQYYWEVVIGEYHKMVFRFIDILFGAE